MFVSSLDSGSHKIVKHYANSDLAQIVSVTKSSPRSPALVPNVHFTKTAYLTENYLTIWARSEMGWGGWRLESDQSLTKRVQSAELGCVTGDNEALLSLRSAGLDPPPQVQATPWSLTNISPVQQQIKTDQADCYRSYSAQGWSLCLLITPSSEQQSSVCCHAEMRLLWYSSLRSQHSDCWIFAGPGPRWHPAPILSVVSMMGWHGPDMARGKEGVSRRGSEEEEWRGGSVLSISWERQVASTGPVWAVYI